MAGVVASVWGCKDPEKAAAWVRTLPEGKAREDAALSLSADWTRANPREAAEFARTSMPEARQPEMLHIVGMHWGTDDLAGAVAWAEQLSPGVARDQFLSRSLFCLGGKLPCRSSHSGDVAESRSAAE